MAKFFLNTGEFYLISFDARVRFLQRIANGDSDASLNAMVMDREFLYAHGIGWNAEFYSHYSEELELFQLDLLDVEDSLVARSRISTFLADRNIRRFRESAAAFLIDIFPELVIPHQLALFLGNIPLESVRVFICFLSNMLQWSYTSSSCPPCPFCHLNISSIHFFTCRGLQRNDLCDWDRFVYELQHETYQDALDRLFLVLQRWDDLTTLFRQSFSARIDEYFEYTAYGSRRRNIDWLSRVPPMGMQSS
jgi:hypothetical protein